MEPYIWREELNTNIRELDDQHRHFFDILNELRNAFGSFAERGVLVDTFSELIEYMRVHFQTEEELMEQFHYPDLVRHRELHMHFTQRVTELFRDYLQDRADITRTTLGFLQDWLVNHIMTEDMKYRGYLDASNR